VVSARDEQAKAIRKEMTTAMAPETGQVAEWTVGHSELRTEMGVLAPPEIAMKVGEQGITLMSGEELLEAFPYDRLDGWSYTPKVRGRARMFVVSLY
jgi:hypothetical protein